jgi:hypothetical protein
MPSCSNEKWKSLKSVLNPIATNASVTSNIFSKNVHFDKDKNLSTCIIFSYVYRSTGNPLLPALHIFIHGTNIPNHNCNIEFGETLDCIIEVLWKSVEIVNCTSGPLTTTKERTHFGCSFQISQQLTNAMAV